jgi:hypothetical protein
LKVATKVPIVKLRSLRCAVPYALEGLLRREIVAAGGALQNVQHGDQVVFDFSLAETSADVLIGLLNEAGQGQIIWVAAD